MLPNLLQIRERSFELFDDSGHSTQSRSFQEFTAVQRIAKLQQTNVILGDVVDEGTCCIQLTKSELVVVTIIKNIDEIGIERMDALYNTIKKEMGPDIDVESFCCNRITKQLTSSLGNSSTI